MREFTPFREARSQATIPALDEFSHQRLSRVLALRCEVAPLSERVLLRDRCVRAVHAREIGEHLAVRGLLLLSMLTVAPVCQRDSKRGVESDVACTLKQPN